MYASRAATAGTTVDLHAGAAAASTTISSSISGDRAGGGEGAALLEALLAIGAELLQCHLDKRVVDDVLDLHISLDQALLFVKSKVGREAIDVHLAIRVHPGWRNGLVDRRVLDRRRLR